MAAPGVVLAGLDHLVREWRHDATVLERRGDGRGARLLASLADELEGQLVASAEETLNLRDAAQECGYSEDHLGRLVREGKLPNAGRPNAPRLRRTDLPGKKRRVASAPRTGDNLDGFLQDIITSKFGM